MTTYKWTVQFPASKSIYNPNVVIPLGGDEPFPDETDTMNVYPVEVKLALKEQAKTWFNTDFGEFHNVSKYRPYFLSKNQAQAWDVMYENASLKFYKYKRIRTAKGYAFLISSSGEILMSSQLLENLTILSPKFAAAFGMIVSESSPMYSLLPPKKLRDLHVGSSTDLTEVNTDIKICFANEALACDLSMEQIDGLLTGVAKTAPKKSTNVTLNKALSDFNGLITLSTYVNQILPMVAQQPPGCMFFVTKGPHKGRLLYIPNPGGNWLDGITMYVEKGSSKAAVCGEDDNYETNTGPYSIDLPQKHGKSEAKIHKNQGFYLEVVKT